MLDRNKEIKKDLIYLTKCKPLKYGTCKRVIIDKRVSKFYFNDDIIHDYTLELENKYLRKITIIINIGCSI